MNTARTRVSLERSLATPKATSLPWQYCFQDRSWSFASTWCGAREDDVQRQEVASTGHLTVI